MPRAIGSAAQLQPITVVLRNIIRDYPESTCLRELLQNADDSGATEIKFILSTSSRSCDPARLIHPNLAQYEGVPALLVFNNKAFSEKDIESLCRVGDSDKWDDPAVTGKFGRGFNSVYHWTDGPSIYSEDRILFQDPHDYCKFPDPGGSYYATTENPNDDEDPHCLHAKAHLESFQAFHFDPKDPFPGTIIRIPLRTAAQAQRSEICPKETTVAMIRDALIEFARELGDGGLLFVKNIHKVTMQKDNEVLSYTRITPSSCDAIAKKNGIVENIRNKSPCAPCFEMTIEHRLGNRVQTQAYAVQHLLRAKESCKGVNSDWVQKEKLFPWVAIAAPLSSSTTGSKPLFSTLRIGISVNQPVYLHGLWAITPDRDHLTSSKDAMAWNDLMFSDLVVEVWRRLLVYRNSLSSYDDKFRFWPRPVESASDPTYPVYNAFVGSVVDMDLAIWSTRFSFIKISEAFCASEEDEYTLPLSAVKMPVVYLPPDLQKMVRGLNPSVKLRTPETALAFLLSTDNLQSASSETKLKLLEYSMQSKRYEDLAAVPFWPNMEGKFITLINCNVFLPRNAEEQSLFEVSRRAITIDRMQLNDRIASPLNCDLGVLVSKGKLRFRKIRDLKYDWPWPHAVHDPHGVEVMPPPKRLADFWSWLCDRADDLEDNALRAELQALPSTLAVFPLRGRSIQQLRSSPNVPLTLVIRADSELGELVFRIFDLAGEIVNILDETNIQERGLDLAKRISRLVPEALLVSADNLFGLLKWLGQISTHLNQLCDKDKELLTREIYRTSKAHDHSQIDEIARLLRALPIFLKATPSNTLTPIRLDWSTLLRDDEYVALGDLPAVPFKQNTTFVDISYPAMAHLCKAFRVVLSPRPKEMLERYLVPAVQTRNSSDALSVIFVDYILRISSSLPESWKATLGYISIIPSVSLDSAGPLEPITNLFDPQSRDFSGIFFPNETVFPHNELYKRNSRILKECGLQVNLTGKSIRSRILHFESCNESCEDLSRKIEAFVQTKLTEQELLDAELLHDLISKRWILDVNGSLVRPADCRPSQDHDLVCHVLALTNVQVSPSWHQALGWGSLIPVPILLHQIQGAVSKCNSNERYENASTEVKAVLEYLDRNYRQEDFIDDLITMECVSGSKFFYHRANAFSPTEPTMSRLISRLAPHMDVAQVSRIPRAIYEKLQLGSKPNIQDILRVQECISGCRVDPDILDVFDATLAIAASYPHGEIDKLLAPDEAGELRPLADLTIPDPRREMRIDDRQVSLNYAHSSLTIPPLSKLRVSTLQDRILQYELEDEEDAFEPCEDLPTNIRDCLSRYPIQATFNEFLANAEDSGASTIRWMVDNCSPRSYPSKHLLGPGLSCIQGPALFVYNDQQFSEIDFRGLKNLGVGSKFENAFSIGMHGRGALTMYHFTDLPMLISGKDFLILDPQQLHLPLRHPHQNRKGRNERKAGIRLPISRARGFFRDHLAPFDSVFGYRSTEDEFKGTIFRFPFRDSGSKSSLVDPSSLIDAQDTARLLMEYFNTAKKSLLFLRNVRSIEFYNKRSGDPCWTVRATCHRTGQNLVRQIAMDYSCVTRKDSKDVVETSKKTWLVATKSPAPPKSESIPCKLNLKKVQCGIAVMWKALLPDNNFFCSLPTDFISHLPVSIHATFAMTSDRQTIPLRDSTRETESAWNQWLLTECVPDLYLSVLAELCEVKPQNTFQMWPCPVTNMSQLSNAVFDGFWKRLSKATDAKLLRIFPTIACMKVPPPLPNPRAPCRHVVDLSSARFSFLPGRDLDSFLEKRYDNIVRLPKQQLEDVFKSKIDPADYSSLDEEFLCELFREQDACKELEETLQAKSLSGKGSEVIFWDSLMAAMMGQPARGNEIQKQPVDLLNGCRVLPLLGGELGTLRVSNPAGMSPCYLLGDDTETKLFHFAKDLMISYDYFTTNESQFLSHPKNQLKRLIELGAFNVRKLNISDLERLLQHPACPLRVYSPDNLEWLEWLHSYIRTKVQGQISTSPTSAYGFGDDYNHFQEAMDELGIARLPIYLASSNGSHRFISPNDFCAGVFMLQPSHPQQARMLSSIPVLGIVDSKYVPPILREREKTLYSDHAFTRLMKCLLTLAPNSPTELNRLLANHLDSENLQVLQEVLLWNVERTDSLPHDHRWLLRGMPVFPRLKPSTSDMSKTFIALASGAIVCVDRRMIHPWVQRLDKWIDPEFCQKHNRVLSKLLGREPLSMDEIWDETAQYFPAQGTILKATELEEYRIFVKELWKSKHLINCPKPLVPNTAGRLCDPGALYDNLDPIFQAAFRCEDKLVHTSVRHLRDYWLRLGLRTRSSTSEYSPSHYLECIKALLRRTQNPQFSRDARIVTQYVCQMAPFSPMPWDRDVALEILSSPVFHRRAVSLSEKTYRQRRMRELADRQQFLAPREAGRIQHLNICWSQLPFIETEPIERLYISLHRTHAPDVEIVFSHLKYLVSIRSSISKAELPAYLKDIQDTYSDLQEYSLPFDARHEIRTANVWFNLDNANVDVVNPEDLEPSLTSVDCLCFKCPVDPHPMKTVRYFLTPYEKLLTALGCESVRLPPSIEAPKKQPTDTVLSGQARIRAKGLLFDVTLKAKDGEIRAHRFALASRSEFFETSSKDEWRKGEIDLRDIDHKVLSIVVDYLYTDALPLPKVDTEDVEQLANDIDDCVDILRAAHYLRIPTLHAKIELFILDKASVFIRPDNVRELEAIAEENMATNLQRYCKAYERENLKVVNMVERIKND